MLRMKTQSRKRNETLLAAALGLAVTMCGAGRDCDDWVSRVEGLGRSQRAELDSYGARAEGGWILLGERTVADCELRARFSRFAGRVVQGNAPDPPDSAAVRVNSGTFVEALVKIWPTRGVHFPGSDGAFRGDLSTLLVRDEVDVAAMRPLIAKILREDGISDETAYALLTRPDPELRDTLRSYASRSASAQEQILALAVLQRLGDDTRSQLEALAERDDLTPAMREAIAKLLDGYRTHNPPQWDDVIDVAFEQHR